MSNRPENIDDYSVPPKGFIDHKKWEQKPVCSVSERIKQRIDESTLKGIGKYGVTLDRQDLSLRDWLEHAIQEGIDKVKYLQKALDKLDEQDAGTRA